MGRRTIAHAQRAHSPAANYLASSDKGKSRCAPLLHLSLPSHQSGIPCITLPAGAPAAEPRELQTEPPSDEEGK
jgi:hypothetical protein